jgi:hypothetical protein
VSINGTQVITNLDIFAAAGAQHKAIRKTFTVPADSNCLITISFAPATGSPDQNAKVDGIQVLPISATAPGSVAINAGGPAFAPYVADTGFNGGLTINNNPTGARQRCHDDAVPEH